MVTGVVGVVDGGTVVDVGLLHMSVSQHSNEISRELTDRDPKSLFPMPNPNPSP